MSVVDICSSFGHDFAVPSEYIKRAFNALVGGIALPGGSTGAVFQALHDGIRSGDPRTEMELIKNVLGGRYWTWPWLEKKAAEYAARRMWPKYWDESDFPRPFSWWSIPEAERIKLLIRTVSGGSCSIRDFHNFSEACGNVPSWRMELFVGDPRCSVSRFECSRHKRAFEAGRVISLPPYFPGDATYVRLYTGK